MTDDAPKRSLTITDTTFRDGHQSLWASRMPTAMMLPVAERLERSGVATVEVIGHATFDAAVRFLHEDPWERVRKLRAAMPSLTLSGSSAGGTTWWFKRAPEDILVRHLELSIEAGCDAIRFVNGLLDFEPLLGTVEHAHQLGAKAIGALVYSISPVHTDELYEAKARELVEVIGVDTVMIKDSGGLLTPERTGSLVDAVRRGAGNVPVTMHSHCMTGLAPRVYMVAAEHGVDDVQCAIWPLADGPSQPSAQRTIRNLLSAGFDVPVGLDLIDAAGGYLETVARAEGRTIGRPVEYDHSHFSHRLPGGMLTNLTAQLADVGLLDRLEETLEETARVRAELGWVPMMTPYSQFVVAQALLNVTNKERYSAIPNEVKMYARGHFGAVLGEIEPDVLDKIMSDPSGYDLESGPLPPILPELREKYPNADDGELVLRYLCPGKDVDQVIEHRDDANAQLYRAYAGTPASLREVVGLIGRMAARSDTHSISVSRGDMKLRVVHER